MYPTLTAQEQNDGLMYTVHNLVRRRSQSNRSLVGAEIEVYGPYIVQHAVREAPQPIEPSRAS